MKIVKLYKYFRADGGVTVSSNKPDIEYSEMFRLIADEDKVLTNGTYTTACIDVDSVEGWEEIPNPEPHDFLTAEQG